MAKIGHKFKHKNLVIWAEEGQICVEDHRCDPKDDGAFTVMEVGDLQARAAGVRRTLETFKYPYDRQMMERFLDDCKKTISDAIKQGRKDDPRAVADALKERRKKMIAMGISNPDPKGAIPAQLAPENAELPPIPQPTGPKNVDNS